MGYLAVGGVLAASMLLAGCGGGSASGGDASVSATATAAGGGSVLMESERVTALDQPVQYPKKRPAEISSSVLQLEPGQESGWRKYRAPVYVYVLEGTASIEYDAGVTKEFPAGEAFLQATDVWHNISNKGTDPLRMLTVTMGAKGIKPIYER